MNPNPPAFDRFGNPVIWLAAWPFVLGLLVLVAHGC
jgi:hypothetical protein